MRYVFIISILCLFFIACKKDNGTAAPQLTYKSVSKTVLSRGDYIQFTLSFTDPAGNADSIFVEKINPHCDASDDSEIYALSPFVSSKNQQADILITYGYGVIPLIKEPQCDFNDTCYFRFVLKGSNNNHSDTVNSETIVIIK